MRLSTKNAWARHVRRRWQANALKGAMAEWGLTEGQARGLLYAQVSQSTLDQILAHPRGGFGLGLEILVMATGVTLEAFIEQQAEEARRERAQWEARERRLAGLEANLRRRAAEPHVVDGRDA